ncbi:hypothetical protein V6N11_024996 [Hibiscus sabdariffa]|uniref:Uncharacterized protein n=1 Tax=Hibiscus sabdariffa TaxID=183260 RepID=A0ABR2QNT1_9ROSI
MGNGHSLLFWSDCWVSNIGRLDCLALPQASIDPQTRVIDLVGHDGSWNWDLLRELIVPHALDAVLKLSNGGQQRIDALDAQAFEAFLGTVGGSLEEVIPKEGQMGHGGYVVMVTIVGKALELQR